jgi:hypothetical protein
MELQALRYAAAVWVMTFDELMWTYARHLKVLGEEDQETSSLWPHGAAATRYRQPSRTSRWRRSATPGRGVTVRVRRSLVSTPRGRSRSLCDDLWDARRG